MLHLNEMRWVCKYIERWSESYLIFFDCRVCQTIVETKLYSSFEGNLDKREEYVPMFKVNSIN